MHLGVTRRLKYRKRTVRPKHRRAKIKFDCLNVNLLARKSVDSLQLYDFFP